MTQTQSNKTDQAPIKSSTPPPKTAGGYAVIWILMFIFNFVFTRPKMMVPVSIIAVFMIFLAGALFKERKNLRPFALFAGITAIAFISTTYVGTILLEYPVTNLLDIQAPPLYVTLFYLLAFLNAANFMTIGPVLFRYLNRPRGIILSILANALLFAGIIYGIRKFVEIYIIPALA